VRKINLVIGALPLVIALTLILQWAPVNSLAEGETAGIDLKRPEAAFLESNAVAKEKGATAEWRKMEGVALDAKNKKLYIAVTEMAKGMADDKGDIKVKENKCGAVYMADLDANFDIKSLKPVVVGGPFDENNKENPCNVDAIANPDNVAVDSAGNLWIGEDTSLHANNVLWVWDGKELKRFVTVPQEAEVTGLRITANDTVFMNVQHPGAMNIYPYNRGIVGGVTGFKASADFKSLPVPQGDDTRQVKLAAGKYQILGRVGEMIPQDGQGNHFGRIDKADGKLLLTCNNPDGNMFLPTNSVGTEGYLYTNFECIPGGVSKVYIRQGQEGAWEVLEGENVDFHSVNGTWNNCNASVTPWNTALTSEEYPPDNPEDLQGWQDENGKVMTEYLGKAANQYDYGWIVELIPQSVGTKVVKHYTLGRFSHENTMIMPDQKTAYFGDDGTDRILYKFVADTEGDLSAGTLYAAKVTQNEDTFNLNWIELGKGNDANLGEALRSTDQS